MVDDKLSGFVSIIWLKNNRYMEKKKSRCGFYDLSEIDISRKVLKFSLRFQAIESCTKRLQVTVKHMVLQNTLSQKLNPSVGFLALFPDLMEALLIYYLSSLLFCSSEYYNTIVLTYMS